MKTFFLEAEIARRFGAKAYNWLITVGPKVLIAVLAFFIGQWVIRMVNRWLGKLLQGKRFDVTLRPFLQNVFNIVLQILLVLGLMQILGIQMTIFAAVIAAFGVAAGLALSGTLQNFASGVLIIALKPFKIGDNISTQGQEGTVTSIRLFYTVILTYANTTLIVPNSKLSNDVIFNLSRQGKRRLDIFLKFSYAIEYEKIRMLLQKTIDSMPECLKNPAPRIGIDKLDADGYEVMINVWSNAHGFNDMRLGLQEKIMHDLKSGDIKLPDMA